jgi:hypothetical protein
MPIPAVVKGLVVSLRHLTADSGHSRTPQNGEHQSNMSHPVKRIGAAAYLGELRRKLLKIYPLRFRRESVLSRCTLVGKLFRAA